MRGVNPRLRTVLLLVLASRARPAAPACPVAPAIPVAPAAAASPAPKSSAGLGLEYVGGTAIQAKDPKALSAWYNDRFGLPMKGEMPGGSYGGFEWNGTSFNIAIVAAGGKHPNNVRVSMSSTDLVAQERGASRSAPFVLRGVLPTMSDRLREPVYEPAGSTDREGGKATHAPRGGAVGR